MNEGNLYDVAVIGGGPCGATAAGDLASQGYKVALLDRAGRIKPCGGAVPPRLIRDFSIPDHLIVAKIKSARIVSPTNRKIDMPIDGGYVGMVDREVFDEWLRDRAALLGAERLTGTFETLEQNADGTVALTYRPQGEGKKGQRQVIIARSVIGADGARSKVAKQAIPGGEDVPCVFAYHEIIESPSDVDVTQGTEFDEARCDVYYQGRVSPDFYGWVFPHGSKTSVGMGSAHKGLSLRGATAVLRKEAGMTSHKTIREEGAPIPMKPLKRWDNGQNVVVAGDAAGVVAPASGEGIYYAMHCGRVVGEAVAAFLASKDARHLASARKRFMKGHGRVFWVLGMMQSFWYRSDRRRERFRCPSADFYERHGSSSGRCAAGKELGRRPDGRAG